MKTIRSRRVRETLGRVARYTLLRGLALAVTVIIAVYLTVVIANMGGKVDDIRRGMIKESIAMMVLANEELRKMPAEERQAVLLEMEQLEVERQGLNRPFIVRSFEYLWTALTLDLGRASYISSDSGSRQVRLILLERLSPTLLLWATAQIMIFFIALFFALILSSRYGSFFDKLVIMLAPTSAAPGWFYGLFLILIFAAVLKLLPFGGLVDAPPPQGFWPYSLSVLKHLVLPVAAQFMSGLFLLIYSWRTFFLIYSSEDYVEMAKAKGLPGGLIERRYVLRPTLPYIITNFMLMLIQVWMGGIILETVFNWPGLGRLLYSAIRLSDTSVIVGSVVLYAYLLAITVFLLDIIYAIVDPRVRIGAEGGKA
ncbi:MAG TPA: ABC transporter permease [Firmicutes bacterium]|nr:ABC transporter permease [Bacillota bacterium]